MQDQLQAIDALLKKREIKKAEMIIAKHLRSQLPPHEQAAMLICRARTRLMNGRPEAAIDDLLTAKSLTPEMFNEAPTLELLADCYFARFELSSVGFTDRNDTHQASSLYQQVVEQFPAYANIGWVYYQWGRVYLTENRNEEAVERFQQALLAASHVPALTAYCYERLGFVAFYEQRDFNRSLAFLNKAIDTYPVSEDRAWLVQIYLLRCRVLREMRDYDHALSSAQKALSLASNGRSEMRIGLAEALLATGELLAEMEGREKELIAYLEQFRQVSRKPLGIDVTWSRVYEMLGDAYFATGKYEEAINAYRAVLQYNPYHPWEVSIYYRVGRAYYQMGHYEKSIETIQRALSAAENEGQPVDYRIYDVYGNAWFALGNYAKAAKAYENALQLAPGGLMNLDKLRQYYQHSLNLIKQTTP